MILINVKLFGLVNYLCFVSFAYRKEELSSKAASRLQLFTRTKSSTDCKVAGGIRELHAAPILFAIYR
jgi:hypothetical protein